jgi:hypothetical protein
LGRLIDWKSLKPALRNVGAAEDPVDNLPNVVDEDKLDARLDTLRHVLVDIRLARGGNNELWGELACCQRNTALLTLDAGA